MGSWREIQLAVMAQMAMMVKTVTASMGIRRILRSVLRAPKTEGLSDYYGPIRGISFHRPLLLASSHNESWDR